ncbi:hypothetical protein [Pectobacterium phage Wc4-1]|uniref:DUF1653 domain-containing protein n=1 Tax=Pectobacterium phage Wc4 TaxID=2652428 RepID=A0A5P8D481_9CAUD|nr:hypothetical protein [Pectobacterium phage Wc4]QFP93970.1 hypothetical protein [Pectobacterium phage Wc4-1]
MVQFSSELPKYLCYKPRQGLYEVLSWCNIKVESTDEWVRGLVYRSNETGEVYSRPLTAFTDNFEVFYS